MFFFISAKAQTRITEKELSEHIIFFASDTLNNKISGNNASAKYIRNEFADADLQMYADNGFQDFEIITGIKADSTNKLKIGNKNAIQKQDYIPLAFSGNGKINAGVAFIGFGLPEDTVNNRKSSYDGINLHNRWALIIRGNLDSKNTKDSTDYKAKAKLAEKHGAVGVLFVSDNEVEGNDVLTELKYERGLTQHKIPIIHISRPFANRIMQMDGKVSIDLQAKSIRKNNEPNSFDTHVTAFANVRLEFIKKETQNIFWQ